MTAVPSLTALTTPPETVATLAFELDQVTVLSVALEGDTVAVRLTVPPTSRVTDDWFRVTLETATTGGSGGSQPVMKPMAIIAAVANAKNDVENFFIGVRSLGICQFADYEDRHF